MITVDNLYSDFYDLVKCVKQPLKLLIAHLLVMLLPCVLASAAASRFRCCHYFLEGNLSGCVWLFLQK